MLACPDLLYSVVRILFPHPIFPASFSSVTIINWHVTLQASHVRPNEMRALLVCTSPTTFTRQSITSKNGSEPVLVLSKTTPEAFRSQRALEI